MRGTVLTSCALVLAGCGGPPRENVALDAAPMQCALPEPGSQCADSKRVLRCEGAEVRQVECSPEQACGPDPAALDGAACIQDGDPCGQVKLAGACRGTILAYCSSVTKSLRVIDCARVHATCAWSQAVRRYTCVTDCELAGVTVQGACVDGKVERCLFDDAGYRVERESCPAGTRCGLVDGTGGVACLPAAACDDVGPTGHCEGDLLSHCVDGRATKTDCAASGERCGYGGSEMGHACLPPGTVGKRVVRGTVRYEDRPSGDSGLGGVVLVPARGVSVAVVRDGAGEVLASAVTADDGTYQLRYDADEESTVFVLAATISSAPTRPLAVLRPDGRVHGVGTPSFAVVDDVERDLVASEGSGVGPAFNIFDMLVTGLDFTRAVFETASPPSLQAVWGRGSLKGTYFDIPSRAIHLLGGPEDDDGYDDAVILHEVGHYVEQSFSRSSSPGGEHGAGVTDPRIAWSEGFATFFSCAVRGSRLYVDSYVGGSWKADLEAEVTVADPTLTMNQEVAESMVSEILWDAGDSASDPQPDDDPILGMSPGEVVRAGSEYFLSPGFSGRGVVGIDLVDWLDGWFALRGTATCGAMREVVFAKRRFPFDFAGCP
ncbi:MAG: hypothetical protein HY698_03515 [Deltaproteobacteria bacterium]|nr:hypothetical protein [Deltaproteobacteria bacterium]